MNSEKCPLCKRNATKKEINTENLYFTCDECGNFFITYLSNVVLYKTPLTKKDRVNIIGWVNSSSENIIKTTDVNKFCSSIITPTFHEKADKLLIYFEELTNFAGELLHFNKTWLHKSWSINKDELNEIINFLFETNRIWKHSLTTSTIKIAPKGWEHLEEIKKVNLNSLQGFVAMWFDEKMEKIYDEYIYQAILNAGYKPHRVDIREHNEKIDDEIIAQIRKSRFVLADFTGHRGGVYYEAGYAMGLGIEVFWSCNEEDLKNLHFDIRQYNCLIWNNDKLEDFQRKLTNRIEAVIGKGTYINKK